MNGLLVFSVFLAVALGGRIPIDDKSPYIVGGKETNITEIPYIVSLHIAADFHCGGSILSRTHILTAAQCVMGKFNIYYIRAGSSKEQIGGVLLDVKNITRHPKFSPKIVDYDVAVIELKTPLNFSKTIQPIKLIDKEPSDGEQVLASGWGSVTEDGYPISNLHSVLVPMVNRKTCETNYQKYKPITSRMICAGAEGKDVCFGDSGGPLAYKGMVAGIASHGIGCGRKGFPGVYTNIADPEVRKFIKEQANI